MLIEEPHKLSVAEFTAARLREMARYLIFEAEKLEATITATPETSPWVAVLF